MTTPRARRRAAPSRRCRLGAGGGEVINSTHCAALRPPFASLVVPILEITDVALAIPVEIPVITHISLGSGGRALPRVALTAGTVPRRGSDLVDLAGGAHPESLRGRPLGGLSRIRG